MNTIIDFINEQTKIFGIGSTELIKIINDKIPAADQNLNDVQKEQIRKLLESDTKINDFGNGIVDDPTKLKFTELKGNLAKLQLLVIMKKMEKSKNCDDVINSFISVFNNKLNTVNDILTTNIQIGGRNNINYQLKYLKYKNKYIKYKKIL